MARPRVKKPVKPAKKKPVPKAPPAKKKKPAPPAKKKPTPKAPPAKKKPAPPAKKKPTPKAPPAKKKPAPKVKRPPKLTRREAQLEKELARLRAEIGKVRQAVKAQAAADVRRRASEKKSREAEKKQRAALRRKAERQRAAKDAEIRALRLDATRERKRARKELLAERKRAQAAVRKEMLEQRKKLRAAERAAHQAELREKDRTRKRKPKGMPAPRPEVGWEPVDRKNRVKPEKGGSGGDWAYPQFLDWAVKFNAEWLALPAWQGQQFVADGWINSDGSVDFVCIVRWDPEELLCTIARQNQVEGDYTPPPVDDGMIIDFVNRHIRFPFFAAMPRKVLRPNDAKVSIQAHIKSVVCDSPCSDLAEAWLQVHEGDHKRLSYKANPVVLAQGAPPIPSPKAPPAGAPMKVGADQNTQWAKYPGNVVGLWLESDVIPAVVELGLMPCELGVRLRWDQDGLVPIRARGEGGERAASVASLVSRGSEDALRYKDNPLTGGLRLQALLAKPDPDTREQAELDMLQALAKAQNWKV